MQENRKEFETRVQSYFEKIKGMEKTNSEIYKSVFPEGIDKYIIDKKNIYQQKIQDQGPINQSETFKNREMLKSAKDDLDKAVKYMDQAMNSNEMNPYYMTDFLNRYARLREMETQYKTVKKSVERQEMVENLFGSYTTVKERDKSGREKYKSSQELIAERNERLAILGDLYNKEHSFSKEQYLENIVAVVNCYHIDTQKALDREVAEMVNQNDSQPSGFNKLVGDVVNKISNPFKKLIGTVKNFMHIGESVPTVEDKDLVDAKKNFDGHQALKVLGEASEMMAEYNLESQEKLINEALAQTQDTPEVHNPDVESLIVEMYNKKFEMLEKKYNGNYENEDFKFEVQKLDKAEKGVLSPFGGYGLKSPEQISRERLEIQNYLIDKYKPEMKGRFDEVHGLVMEYQFNDLEGQKLYEEVNKTFNTIDAQRNDLERIQIERQEQVDEINKHIRLNHANYNSAERGL